jgi:Leucine-rich repeat (LRR) protein
MQGWPLSGTSRRSISYSAIRSPMKVFVISGTFNLWICHIAGGFTDAGLASLGNLKKIDLTHCDQITDEGLRHLGNLQSLDLSFCLGFTGSGLASLGNLKEIDLSGCSQITDDRVLQNSETFWLTRGLTVVYLRRCNERPTHE